MQLQHGLGDKLERAAGGFMNKGEATRVRDKRLQGKNRQMEEVITILRGKSDEDFEIFCKILQESNNKTWADELKKEAEQFKREIGKYEPSKMYSISSITMMQHRGLIIVSGFEKTTHFVQFIDFELVTPC